MRNLNRYLQDLKTDLSGRNFHAYNIPDFFAEQSLGNRSGDGHFPGFQIGFSLRNNMVFHDHIARKCF